MLEVLEIIERCKTCGTGTALLVQDEYLGMDGHLRLAVWRDEPEHTRMDCKRFVALQREQWPTLW